MRSLAVALREAPVELTADRRFAVRVRRLAAVSVPGLGAIFALSVGTLAAPAAVDAAFALGWATMPALLYASLRRPRLRYALVIPSVLVGAGLVAVCAAWLPEDGVAAAGWLLTTAGIAAGGVLGLWFWFRLLPVPRALDDPFSRGRWALVAVHVALVVAGLLLVAAAAVA